MKRLLFLVVSLCIAGYTYATDFGKDVIAKVTNSNEISVSEQSQSLILEQIADMQNGVGVYSHSSHRSHSSHSSHRSHYSSRMM